LCWGTFSNKNTRISPVKEEEEEEEKEKKKPDFGFVQAFCEMTPEITGSHIYQHVLMATRTPGRPSE
jgi:hypothetical protein